MLIVGLYAGVAGGKSTAARLLAELGARVLDADDMARRATDDPDVRAAIAREFGADVLTATGEVDRTVLGRRVFADADARARLEAIIHPVVRREMIARLDELQQQRDASPAQPPAVVLDVPLLLGSPLEARCTHHVFVDTAPTLRAERAQADRGWDSAEVARREEAQPDEAAKRLRCERTLDNNGDLDHLRAQVRALWLDWSLPLPAS